MRYQEHACSSHLELIRGLVASEVHEVNRPGPRHEVDRDREHENAKECEPRRKIVAGLLPQPPQHLPLPQAPDLHTEHRDQHRDGGQVDPMADQVAVPQLHVLEVNGLQEVGEAAPDPDGECGRASVGAGGLHAPVDDLGGQQSVLSS